MYKCPRCGTDYLPQDVGDYVSEFREMFPSAFESVSFRSVVRSLMGEGCGQAFHAWGVGCGADSVTLDGDETCLCEIPFTGECRSCQAVAR